MLCRHYVLPLCMIAAFALSASASDLAARLRARMNARPKPAIIRREGKPVPGNQAACQALINGSRQKRPKINLFKDYGSTELDFRKALTRCSGSEAVDRVMSRTHTNQGRTFRGHEAPTWSVSEMDSRGYAEMKVRLGVRARGETEVEAAIDVGFDRVTAGRAKHKRLVSQNGPFIGVFPTDSVADKHSELLVSYSTSSFRRHYNRTEAPWASLRLDDGRLYIGQFADGGPHGFGFRFDEEGRVGSMGFFKDGKEHGYQITWVTKDETMHRVGESPGSARAVAVDWVEQKKFKNGVYEKTWSGGYQTILQSGAQGWKRVGKESQLADLGLSETKRVKAAKQAERDAKWAAGKSARDAKYAAAKAKKELALKNLYLSLRPGEVIRIDAGSMKGFHDCVVLQVPAPLSKKQFIATWGEADKLWVGTKFHRVVPDEVVTIPGFGRYRESAADRARMTKAWPRALEKWEAQKRREEAAFAAREAAQEAAALAAQNKPAPFVSSYPSSGNGPIYSSPAPTYRPSTSNTVAPPMTSAEFHEQNKIKNPGNYHQLKY